MGSRMPPPPSSSVDAARHSGGCGSPSLRVRLDGHPQRAGNIGSDSGWALRVPSFELVPNLLEVRLPPRCALRSLTEFHVIGVPRKPKAGERLLAETLGILRGWPLVRSLNGKLASFERNLVRWGRARSGAQVATVATPLVGGALDPQLNSGVRDLLRSTSSARPLAPPGERSTGAFLAAPGLAHTRAASPGAPATQVDRRFPCRRPPSANQATLPHGPIARCRSTQAVGLPKSRSQ
jgi:hypothetical protein